MDSSHTALERVAPPAPVTRPAVAERADTPAEAPIYAQLVAEWREASRSVPQDGGVRWASFAAPAREGRRTWPVLVWGDPSPAPSHQAPDPDPASAGKVPGMPAVPVPRGLTVGPMC